MLKDAYVEWLAKVEANSSSIKAHWKLKQWQRQQQRNICREGGCEGFLPYTEAVQRRLAQHNCTRPFQLYLDYKQQDTLITWVEYLNFECWWLDRFTEATEHFKVSQDTAWQELVQLKLLRPDETPESIRCDSSWRKKQTVAEEEVNRATLEALKVYDMTQNDSQRLRVPEEQRILMLEAATNKLTDAKAQLKWIRRRNEQITIFAKLAVLHDHAKENAARQNMLVQWVREQVPLIEAEMAPSDKIQAKKAAKRRHIIDEDDEEEQSHKKQKLGRQDLNSLTAGNTIILAQTRESYAESDLALDSMKGPITRSLRQSINTPPAVSQGIRRSARIAAQRNSPKTDVRSDGARSGLRSSNSQVYPTGYWRL